MRGTEIIVVHRPSTERDRFGQAAGFLPDRPVRGCVIVPRTSSEDASQRTDQTIIGVTVYAPGGTDIVATDQITARGVRWQVDGMPGDYRSAGGQRKAVAVNLRRVEG